MSEKVTGYLGEINEQNMYGIIKGGFPLLRFDDEEEYLLYLKDQSEEDKGH